MTRRERIRHREHRAALIAEHGRALREMFPADPVTPADMAALLGRLP